VLAGIRAGLRGILPESLRRVWQRGRLEAIRWRNRKRGVAEIFSEIYEANRWGGARGHFHSGGGSTIEHAEVYAGVIKRFVREHQVRHVVDLGCGDFRVGARLIDGIDISYIGVDIVAPLIQNNRRRYGSERVRFACLNIIDDELPDGDLCMIRQVLQHLSNEQIDRVLKNVQKYRFVIVTEHYPAPGALRERNRDKPCGEDVRIYDGSGVFLDAPPFNRKVSGPLLDVNAGHCLMHTGERIRTFLLDNSDPELRSAPKLI
jgi:SAM-dependent methyltransferase